MYKTAMEEAGADTSEYDVDKHQWGKPEGTDYYKRLTPGQSPEPKKSTLKEEEPAGAESKEKYRLDNEKNTENLPDDFEFSEVEIKQMEAEIDNMSFEDMVELEVFEADEIEDLDSYDYDLEIDDEDEDEDESLDEALTIQGRMKRRFAARRNRQKLKVARMRASRRAADPNRLKKRASRGARNMIKQRFARGRDISSMPPQEKARIEAMAKRFAPLVQRLAVRMLPQVRRNELARIKSAGSSMKSQKAKKFKISKGGSASKYKAKKYKIKKAGK